MTVPNVNGVLDKRIVIKGDQLGTGASLERDCIAARCFLLKAMTRRGPQLPPGAFARVYKGELDGQAVALKILLPVWCNPAEGQCRRFQEDFMREGNFLQECNHE